jgi:retron-type reverse transcriptase
VPASDSSSVFSYRNIYQRYLDCRRNKRSTNNALKFEINAGERILELETSLKNKTYHPSRSILFAAKKPKLREIFAADFKDRVVHHVLVHELEKIWESIFIHDSYACRIGKGTHQAVTRLQSFLRKITHNGNLRAYYLQLDIKDFFTSIDKDILFSLLKKHVKDPDILWLIKTVLFWDCTKLYVSRGDRDLLAQVPPNKSLFGKNNKRGLPIGNLTSQFFANVYLNELDQYVKHELKAHYYLRYVDDFVIVSSDWDELLRFKEQIKLFVESRLKLQLHPKRHKLLPVSSGIDFLGYIIRHNYILVRRRVLNNLKQKIREFVTSEAKDLQKFKATLSSYAGHFKFANTYRLKQKVSILTGGLSDAL